ncbi:MAG: hypothetical protein IIC84_01585 [Chloroflexi bacterium]|nr:hypothetical protein [Chloroflexota bacterium]
MKLPLSEDRKTGLWASSIASRQTKEWVYFRCVEIAMQELVRNAPADKFSMLEFGVASGDRFIKLLQFRDYWMKKLEIKSRIIGIGFDRFENPSNLRPEDTKVSRKGRHHSGDMEDLQRFLVPRFGDFLLAKGLFSDALEKKHSVLQEFPPIFVSIDSEYYSSTMDVLERIIPELAPHGCLFYFDDVMLNYWSDKSGQMRAIAEVNAGMFGPHIQLVEYPMTLETGLVQHYKRFYRLVNLEHADKETDVERVRPPLQMSNRKRVAPL